MVDLTAGGPVDPPSRWLTSERGGQRLRFGGALVCILFLIALLAPLLAPHDPIEQDLLSAQLPPPGCRVANGPFARHRQPGPLRPFTPDVRRKDGGSRGADRGFACGGHRNCLRPCRWYVRRLDRPERLAPDRCLDGISPGVVVDRAGGGDWRGPDLGYCRYRCRRLDAVRARGPCGNHGAAAARLRRGRACPRIEPYADALARDPSQSRSPDRHLAGRGDGDCDPCRSDPVLCRHLGRRRRPDLGRHDRRGASNRLSVAMGQCASIVCVILSVIGFNLLGDGLRAALDPVQSR